MVKASALLAARIKVPPSKTLEVTVPRPETTSFEALMGRIEAVNAGGNTPGAKLYGSGNAALVLIGLLVKPRVNPL
jgi:hypothetical protein